MRNTPRFALYAALLFFVPALTLHAAEDQNLAFKGLVYPLELKVPAGQKLGATLLETRYSEAPGEAYDTLLIQGEMPSPEVRLDLAVKSPSFLLPDARYEYTAMHRFPNGRFWARYSLKGLSAAQVKLSAVNLGLKADSTVTIYEMETLKAAETREVAQATAAFTYVPDPALSLPENAPFKLVRRAAWKALPPKEAFTPHQPAYFTIHHTQAHYPQTYERAVQEMQFIQDFHQNGRGWIDIGYHFLIDPFGNVYEGRPINVVGAHAKNRNTGNIGISIMGNYHPPVSNVFTPATQNSFIAVGTYLKDTYTVNRSSFYAHRDLQATDCPGDDLYAKVETLRGLIFDPQTLPVKERPDSLQLDAEQLKSLRQLMDLYK